VIVSRGPRTADRSESEIERSTVLLLTGATGFVGGRLLPHLEARGRVRCLLRRPQALGHVGPATEIVVGDALRPETLPAALAGVETAFYLIHSLAASADFDAADRRAAGNFAAAARSAGVRRIIYLGGLGDPSRRLSRHLRSRMETGDVLRESGIEVIELRASVVIGRGSLSFEIVRGLCERLPVILCPAAIDTPAQPLATSDLIAYLLAALDLPPGPNHTFEIGGERVTFAALFEEYIRQRRLRRPLVRVPLVTPGMLGPLLPMVLPHLGRVGRTLCETMASPMVVEDDAARQAFPIRPLRLREAVAEALADEAASP
jgi:uncharacterized protein YbjT (DUF2867 family)